MATQTAVRTTSSTAPGAASPHWPARVVGALLALGVAAVHYIDQGGLPGSKDPHYVGIGYYVLEVAGVLTAVLLLVPAWRSARAGWVLALGVALGPLLGYVLSRGPGLPDYTDDKGSWGEPIGVVSLVVEGVLLLLALTEVLGGSRRVVR